ncbi:MAG: hypothetical protein BWY29_00502 [Microgenomates group bacterium ADurb.Bin238]|nr:MAG: hypothetical protein BWY29_00502 [Microgenomates group bacterium ADurb.Bin238]
MELLLALLCPLGLVIIGLICYWISFQLAKSYGVTDEEIVQALSRDRDYL